MQTVRLAVIGLGNVGRRFLELVQDKRELIRERYALDLLVTAAGDTSGGAEYYRGLDVERALELKRSGKGIAAYPEHGRGEMTPLDVVRSCEADVLVENTLTNLKDGQPGLDVMREAIARRMNIATANKGPLVLAYRELLDRAAAQGVRILHSATVCGGLPVLNIGRRDLGACEISRFEGIVNGTTNHILVAMTRGQSYADALKHTQELGFAEADPSLDVDGWDAANKLALVANAVLRRPTVLADVAVEGIRGVTPEQLREAQANGQVIKLVASAVKSGDDYTLSVKPTRLDASHPLASVADGYMGVIYQTDINGEVFARIREKDPYPTAAAVLRDVINLYA